MRRAKGKIAVVLNLLGIALIYLLCFYHGNQLGDNPVTNDDNMEFSDVIAGVAKEHHIHPALIAAVIHAESNFNPLAQSYKGARGLMQITPPTQRYLRVKNIYDPRENVEAGTRYLRELIDRFGGDLVMALAAYNAGPYAVDRHDGVPPFKETHRYIEKVLSYYQYYRQVFLSNPLMS